MVTEIRNPEVGVKIEQIPIRERQTVEILDRFPVPGKNQLSPLLKCHPGQGVDFPSRREPVHQIYETFFPFPDYGIINVPIL